MTTIQTASVKRYHDPRLSAKNAITSLSLNKLVKTEVELHFGTKSRLNRKVKLASPYYLYQKDNTIEIGVDDEYIVDEDGFVIDENIISIEYQIVNEKIHYKTRIPEFEHFIETTLDKRWDQNKIDLLISLNSETHSEGFIEVDVRQFKQMLLVFSALSHLFVDNLSELDIQRPVSDTRDEYQEWKEEACYA